MNLEEKTSSVAKRILVIDVAVGAIAGAIFLSGYVYTAFKFGNPLFGRNDFFNYQRMIDRPFDFSAAPGPFAMRQIPALLASAFYDLGVHYETESVADLIELTEDMKRRFLAFILSNAAAVALSFGLLVGYLKARICKFGLIESFSLFGIFAAWFYFPGGVISPIAIGWGWLCSSLFAVAFVERSVLLTLLGAMLALFTRETTIIFALCMFSARLILERSYQLKPLLSVVILGTTCLAYFFLRISLTSGYEFQIEPHALLGGLTSFSITKKFLFQSVIPQSELALLVVAIAMKKGSDAVCLTFGVLGITIVGAAARESQLGLLWGETLPIYAVIFLVNRLRSQVSSTSL